MTYLKSFSEANKIFEVDQVSIPTKNAPFKGRTSEQIIAELQENIKYLRAILDAKERDYATLYKMYRDSVPLGIITEAFTKYARVRKLPWKPVRNNNIISSFISILEHTEVPTGEEDLVD